MVAGRRVSVAGQTFYASSDFRLWHETDMPTVFRDVRFRGQSGKHLLALSFSGLDPDCVVSALLPFLLTKYHRRPLKPVGRCVRPMTCMLVAESACSTFRRTLRSCSEHRSTAGLGTGKAQHYFASDFDRLSNRLFKPSEMTSIEVGSA